MAKNTPTTKNNQLKIALVHDWLTNMRGGERVLLALKEAFPTADIYTSVYEPKNLPDFNKYQDQIKTTWLQKLPGPLRRFHQLFPVLRVFAFRSLNLKNYDIIISDTSSDAKQVRGGPKTKHICYLFTPTRYYWSHYQEYKSNPGFGKLNVIIRPFIPPLVWLMKKFDLAAAKNRVDQFIAISTEVQARIKKYYGRDSSIIFPPADVDKVKFNANTKDRVGYVVLGAQVGYKRADLAIQACQKLGVPLTLIGSGPEHTKLKELAENNPRITFLTDCSDQEKIELLGSFKAQIFPQEEDYGITAIECMASGTPVIAYAKGGALDTVADGISGLYFKKQTVDSLAGAITKIESGQVKLSPQKVRAQALKFSKAEFIKQIQKEVFKSSKAR